MSKISIKNLDLYYSDFKALKNVNLEIEANKITAFIGPSGCGKSTLLKSINRMNDLVEGCRIEGSIELDGQNIFKGMDVNLLRKRVGMVFQKPNPFPMSIYDNIAYGPRTHGIHSKSKLDDIVEKSLRNAAIWDECQDPRHPLQVKAGRHCGEIPAQRGYLGRVQGPSQDKRPWHVRRTAAEAVHRQSPGCGAGGAAHG